MLGISLEVRPEDLLAGSLRLFHFPATHHSAARMRRDPVTKPAKAGRSVRVHGWRAITQVTMCSMAVLLDERWSRKSPTRVSNPGGAFSASVRLGAALTYDGIVDVFRDGCWTDLERAGSGDTEGIFAPTGIARVSTAIANHNGLALAG
jgi:hypothetical protein